MRIVIAVLVGIVIGFVVFAYTPIGVRYEVKSFGGGKGVLYKYDKWTGQTYWRRLSKTGVWTLLP